MDIFPKTPIDESTKGIGSRLSVNLVSKCGSDKVYVFMFEDLSRKLQIVEVSDEFKFQLQDHKSNRLYMH